MLPRRTERVMVSRGVGLLACVVALWVLAGCTRPAARAPSPPPRPAAPKPYRVAVVDLDRIAKEHPQARELTELRRRIAQTEAALMVPPPPPPLPVPSVSPVTRRVQEEAQRELARYAQELRAVYRRELEARERQARAELERYAQQLQRDAEERLKARQQQVQEDLQRRVEAQKQQVQARVRAYEEQVAREYRLPLLNLRLKLETVQHADRQQYDRLLQEYERLQKERDGKIQAFAEAQQKELQEFARVEEQRAREELEAYRKELEEQTRSQLAEREAQLRAELQQQAQDREREFQRQLRERQRALEQQATAQARGAAQRAQEEFRKVAEAAQRRYEEEQRVRQEQLRRELEALKAQQASLEATILAEVRVEVAQVALEQGLDLVLVRYVSHRNATDITDLVLRRLRGKR
ncbi:MAG: hypothetical protein QN142_06410 [Armatimonadota bacterium]|nr:hypothetical protein [Armatimonadota bacterium]MDR5688821.1 hypothetical protein [Armatimonadota bacterium]MDR7388902.1 hypothetical protein [Armatimonadota bacterium]MDR7391171.1 hypothetical protein [Armatimonadota bacterium]MDR7396081.1 hypothetical protein [Armatimonadota bacterium]